MAQDSKIGWTNNTQNHWIGCDATTNPGCKECYAVYRLLPKMGVQPGKLRRTSEENWEQPYRWQRRLEKTGETETVFNSLTDFFHPGADEWRAEAWEQIRKTPNLIWIILTQRPGNIASRLPADWGDGYPNVWLGTSASDQPHADKRIPTLLKIPAALHLVSLEPLVAPIQLHDTWLEKLKWIITGGMSGDNWHKFRLYPSWVRSLRDQCAGADIPFFFKQLGGPAGAYRDGDQALLDGELHQNVPAATNNPITAVQQITLF